MTLPLFLLPATDKRELTRKKGSFVFIWRGRVQVRENRASDQEFCGKFFAVTVASAFPATVFLAAQTYVFPIFFVFSRGTPASFYSRICHHIFPLSRLRCCLNAVGKRLLCCCICMQAGGGHTLMAAGDSVSRSRPPPIRPHPSPYSSTKTGFTNFAPCLCYQ